MTFPLIFTRIISFWDKAISPDSVWSFERVEFIKEQIAECSSDYILSQWRQFIDRYKHSIRHSHYSELQSKISKRESYLKLKYSGA